MYLLSTFLTTCVICKKLIVNILCNKYLKLEYNFNHFLFNKCRILSLNLAMDVSTFVSSNKDNRKKLPMTRQRTSSLQLRRLIGLFGAWVLLGGVQPERSGLGNLFRWP